MTTLSKILKRKITTDGISKASVAVELGVGEKTIENYMNGKREPSLKDLIKLARLLKFNLSDITDDGEQEENDQEQNVPQGTLRTKTNFYKIEFKTFVDKQSQVAEKVLSSLDSISKNLNEVYDEQVLTRAEVRAFGQYHIMKDSNGNQKKFLDIMAEINKLVGANVTVDEHKDIDLTAGKKRKA